MRTVGRANRGEVEVRYAQLQDGREELDEVVAHDAHVHLEKMHHTEFALIVETATERVCVHLGATRAHVNGMEVWREPVNRRAEAATRRENRRRYGHG